MLVCQLVRWIWRRLQEVDGLSAQQEGDASTGNRKGRAVIGLRSVTGTQLLGSQPCVCTAHLLVLSASGLVARYLEGTGFVKMSDLPDDDDESEAGVCLSWHAFLAMF